MLHAPRLAADLADRRLTEDDLNFEERVEDVRMADAALAGAKLRAVEWRRVVLERGDLADARLEGGGFTDARLEQTNLANLRAHRAALLRVELRGCRLTGLQWADGAWRDVTVSGCGADLATMRHTRLERVAFVDCRLTEADFADARLREVSFERCDLAGVDLRGARFQRVELRGCRLDGLRGIERLDGVSMPWTDVVEAAGVFAAALGVTVSDA